MDLSRIPMDVQARFERDGGVLFGLRPRGDTYAAIAALLAAMDLHAEASVADPEVEDGALVVRRTVHGWARRGGRYGCAGDWRPCDIAEGAGDLAAAFASCDEGQAVNLWVPAR